MTLKQCNGNNIYDRNIYRNIIGNKLEKSNL